MKSSQTSSTTLNRAWWALPLITAACSWGWAMMYGSQLAWMLMYTFCFLSFVIFLAQVLRSPER